MATDSALNNQAQKAVAALIAKNPQSAERILGALLSATLEAFKTFHIETADVDALYKILKGARHPVLRDVETR